MYDQDDDKHTSGPTIWTTRGASISMLVVLLASPTANPPGLPLAYQLDHRGYRTVFLSVRLAGGDDGFVGPGWRCAFLRQERWDRLTSDSQQEYAGKGRNNPPLFSI
ncbi:hypothetical protein I7I53_06797 [Histoplasma capsulatum var. duboisii H88]|uniref:Uncharacterized protein n=1 Tax=Ajellomyces capsulatus (strain H88) TaxID=544711 RepID=A0A8A1LBN6_AJEC8|nr:hypothetical protein I7I53_06797 [Histoplasma capsulatum var. duboisii H88]